MRTRECVPLENDGSVFFNPPSLSFSVYDLELAYLSICLS